MPNINNAKYLPKNDRLEPDALNVWGRTVGGSIDRFLEMDGLVIGLTVSFRSQCFTPWMVRRIWPVTLVFYIVSAPKLLRYWWTTFLSRASCCLGSSSSGCTRNLEDKSMMVICTMLFQCATGWWLQDQLKKLGKCIAFKSSTVILSALLEHSSINLTCSGHEIMIFALWNKRL